MADSRYEALYNCLQDVTACIHIPLTLFAIYVIVRHTPPQLRHYSYFTLNAMSWKLLANFIMSFMHFYPLFPALCVRAGGISRQFVGNEEFGFWLFILQPLMTIQCSLALMIAFPHRYIVFVHPKLAARIRPVWVFPVCGAAHVLGALFYFPLAYGSIVSSDRYPNSLADLPDTRFVFCINPNGMNAALTCIFAAGSAIGTFIVVGSSFLFLRKVRRLQREITHDETLALQKKVIASLLMLTAITMFCGGIPIVAIVCSLLFPSAPYNREMTMISLVVLCNHGGVSAIAYLVFFKAY